MTDLKTIAFYLPQYHPIPENDAWWGKGFTDWTNVRAAEPRFPGHEQPHVPERLGYYDLRSPETRKAQAELAAEYGIYGFCYYHYWFSGKRLLEQPFDAVLKSGEPKFPFCLCWANENWSRRWDGYDRDLLMAQHYSDEDDLDFIRDLIPAFRDGRYIRVNGKPLLLLYRTGLLPDPKRTANIWREAMIKAGIGDLYLVRVENHMDGQEVNPADIGFDAAMEFAPYWASKGDKIRNLKEVGRADQALPDDLNVYDYERIMRNMLARSMPAYKLFRGVFPCWDNSARRKSGPMIFVNSTPDKYAYWLSQAAQFTLDKHRGDERLLFINAWNEWGEGCHLEPDARHGAAFLEATRMVMQQARDTQETLGALAPVLEQGSDAVRRWYTSLQTIYGNASGLTGRDKEMLIAFKNLIQKDPELEALLKQKDELIHQKDRTISELEHSLIWRSTASLRKIADRLRGK